MGFHSQISYLKEILPIQLTKTHD